LGQRKKEEEGVKRETGNKMSKGKQMSGQWKEKGPGWRVEKTGGEKRLEGSLNIKELPDLIRQITW